MRKGLDKKIALSLSHRAALLDVAIQEATQIVSPMLLGSGY